MSKSLQQVIHVTFYRGWYSILWLKITNIYSCSYFNKYKNITSKIYIHHTKSFYKTYLLAISSF